MPLVRATLHGMGENLHVAIWPGCERNTIDVTRFIAMESRSFVLSVSGLMRASDVGGDVPFANEIRANAEEFMANGGSCIAGPDGNWIVEPQVGEEQLVVADLDYHKVFEERQNLDVSGHYSRPDVVSLNLNRTRQQTINSIDEWTGE